MSLRWQLKRVSARNLDLDRRPNQAKLDGQPARAVADGTFQTSGRESTAAVCGEHSCKVMFGI